MSVGKGSPKEGLGFRERGPKPNNRRLLPIPKNQGDDLLGISNPRNGLYCIQFRNMRQLCRV
jgi:hypothetical protein